MLTRGRLDVTGCVLAVGVAMGFVVVGIAWLGVARTASVARQVPWLVSGSVVGLAIIGTSGALLCLHLERRSQAREARQTQDLLVQAVLLKDALRASTRKPRS